MPTAQWGGGYPLAPSRLAVGNSPVGNSGGGTPTPPFFLVGNGGVPPPCFSGWLERGVNLKSVSPFEMIYFQK